jgi:NADPH:quinone reductase-like Zn-dependent oxidoreductase
VQLAKARGAEVIGTARASKHDALAALGIDDVIDYTTTRFETAVRDIDLVVDLVGGEYAVRSLEVLRPGGLLVYVPSDVLPAGIAAAARSKRIRATSILVEPDHAALEQIAALVDAGRLRVLLEARFPLGQVAEAHATLERQRILGKLVLTT